MNSDSKRAQTATNRHKRPLQIFKNFKGLHRETELWISLVNCKHVPVLHNTSMQIFPSFFQPEKGILFRQWLHTYLVLNIINSRNDLRFFRWVYFGKGFQQSDVLGEVCVLEGAVRDKSFGEVWGEVFGEVSRLALLGYSEQETLQQKLQPESPRPLYRKFWDFFHDEVPQRDPRQV